jgi:putative ABC transport system permease protein
VKADRLRTLLSLSGVAIGIFSIAAALTLVDSLQQALQEGFAAYGNDILYVEREPMEPDLNEDGMFRWWEYTSRPPVTWREYRYLAENAADDFSDIGFAAYGAKTVGVDGNWKLLVQQPLAQGRGFTAEELAEGKPVAVVGSETEAACGDRIWLDGSHYEVIGVFEKAGLTSVSPVDIDHARLVPCRTQKGPILRGSILLSGADPEQIRNHLRVYRRLSPYQKDDFSLNRIAYLLKEMNDIFSLAAKLGWIIGFFSLLAGGIGMANMLYVSVEERRYEIGICRALGARRKTIERQFLGEALILSLLGAAAGIGLLVCIVVLERLLPGLSLKLTISIKTILTGLGISLVIGLLFGAAPARAAARLSPIEAMKKEG